MNFKLFILLVLLTSSTIVAKVDKDLSLAVELENNTLDLSLILSYLKIKQQT